MIRVTVVIANRYVFDTEVVTGRQIKERANLPEGFALYRRTRGGNESIRDDDMVELHEGDHFFAGRRRPVGDWTMTNRGLETKRAHVRHGTAHAGPPHAHGPL